MAWHSPPPLATEAETLHSNSSPINAKLRRGAEALPQLIAVPLKPRQPRMHGEQLSLHGRTSSLGDAKALDGRSMHDASSIL